MHVQHVLPLDKHRSVHVAVAVALRFTGTSVLLRKNLTSQVIHLIPWIGIRTFTFTANVQGSQV